MLYVYPYKPASKGANQIAVALGVDLIGRDVQRLRYPKGSVVINWGLGGLELPEGVKVLNKGAAISTALNKLKTFDALKKAGVSIPDYTTNQATAMAWSKAGAKVCARLKLEGKDGDGLELVAPLRNMPKAKLYTKFVKAKAEYRINICNNRTVGVQLKVQANGEKIKNEDIKTGGNGYGFRLLAEHEIPKGIRPAARAAIAALGLDFGGVDLIVGVDGKPYVLEVNTAPELTPAMVRGYAVALKEMI